MKTKIKPSKEFTITRVYEAPVKAVWEAWVDPQQAAKWWGPRGFKITTHSKDLRVGGHWSYTMHGPDGVDYPNKTIYHEVEKYSRLVYDHGGNDNQPPLFRVEVIFTDLKGKTKMDMTMSVSSVEASIEIQKFIKKASGESTWDRLAEYLEKESSGKDQFVINRSFDVPVNVMFDVWSSPKHLAQWLPPTGFRMEFIRSDLKPGGRSFYFMTDGKMKMYGRIDYLKMERPNLIQYTQEFCDEKEQLSRHPLAPTWPATMLTTVEFTSESADRTRVTVTWEVHAEATREEIETFVAAKSGMSQGWTGSFDKLDEYLENV